MTVQELQQLRTNSLTQLMKHVSSGTAVTGITQGGTPRTSEYPHISSRYLAYYIATFGIVLMYSKSFAIVYFL